MRIDKSTLLLPTPPERGKGRLMWWVFHHTGHQGDDCLLWPFYHRHGYPTLRHDGKKQYAHRLMCELVNGPPPTPKHQASHSCGRGKQGCMNPRHLSWKTHSGNQLDRRDHGTKAGYPRKLSYADAQRIRELAKHKSQVAIAAEYGVARTTIGHVLTGRSWTKPPASQSDELWACQS